jgi:hypothetical protein
MSSTTEGALLEVVSEASHHRQSIGEAGIDDWTR